MAATFLAGPTPAWADRKWKINAKAGPGGTIAPIGYVRVEQGSDQTFAITPSSGHHIASVTVDGVPVGPVTSYTFVAVTADHTIVATFAPDFVLTVAADGGGQVVKSPDLTSYAPGTGVTLTAIPDPGWQFEEWTGDVSGTTNPVAVVMNGDRSVTARFAQEPTPYTLTVTTVGSGGVARNPNLPAYPAGSTVQLTATAAADWTFVGWSGDTTTNANPITVSMHGHRTYTANFKLPLFLAASSHFAVYPPVLPPAWGDYDNDGFVDLTLYHSIGAGSFGDIPGFRLAVENGNYHGAAWCDYDRDGDLDLGLLPYEGEEMPATGGGGDVSGEAVITGRLRILRNDNGYFTDVAPALGMDKVGYGETAVWADFDADGWPDLFAPFYAHVSPHQSFLFHNNGDGTFTEVSAAAGVALAGVPASLKPEGAHAVDFDDDGDLDLYCASHLFLNDGHGVFTDVRAQVGLPAIFDEGAMFVDYDNDGDFDLNLRAVTGPRLYRNDAGFFTDVTTAAGLPALGFNWGDSWADVDNDGDLDGYFMAPSFGRAYLMLNQGDGTFVRDTTHKVLDSSGLGAWADYDRDGDLDLHLEARDRHIIRNTRNRRPEFAGSCLRVLVLDADGLRTEFGATVRLRRLDDPSGGVQTRAVDGGSGYLTQSEYTVHFGTSPTGSYALEISFPSRPDSRIIVGPTSTAWLGALSPLALHGMVVVVRRDGTAYMAQEQMPLDVRAGDAAKPPLLSPPAPNPSSGPTTLRFRLDGAQQVSLIIHDVAGRSVRRARLGQVGPGDHEWQWDGRDDHGRPVPTGVYLSRLVLGDGQSAEQRIVKLR